MGADDGAAPARPVLTGQTVTLRPGRPGDGELLRDILAEPSVSRWWADTAPAAELEARLRSDGPAVLLVIEIDGEVAGGIQYDEEDDPQYRHAGIDIFLAGRFQGRGAGPEAVALLAGSCSTGAVITGSRSTRRRPTSGRSAAMPRSASGPWG